ncbi:ABC transporter permease [Bacillus thermotolerans]|uniref:ABC transporter permease n=1 Tax=Bacillus thermotolerans TaxID=1221996 RepID=UPI000588F46C|nr:ABC transporter permease [Bacillus thermotolerans]KKB41794.1 ABC transporter, permease protein EscB [Bacillus thermotolerans]
MNPINELWKERLTAYYAELRKYLRYMLNDHLLLVLVFALGAGLYYYSGWVKTLDESFPASLLMAVILGLLLSWSSVYTLLMRADTVFLLPLEEQMAPYFRKAITTSFFSQIYLLIAALALFIPLHRQVEGGGTQAFFLWLAVVAAMKIWNLTVRWHVLKMQEKESRQIDWLVRFALNGLLLYFLFSNTSIVFVLIVAVIMVAYLLYFRKASGKATLKWETLVELEEERMAAFYRVANLFTDVPHLRGEVKRRRWMDPLLGKASFEPPHTYDYLFMRTFVRMNEYFGLYVRLTIIAILIIAFSGQLMIQLFVALLFIYLTGFQLLPIIRRHETKMWVSLYPVAQEQKSRSLLSLITRLLAIQSILFGLAVLISNTAMYALIVLAVGLAFSFVFTKLYAPGRLKKITE